MCWFLTLNITLPSNMSSGKWTQGIIGRGSVYALDEDTNKWANRGTSGTVTMFANNANLEDVRIKWEKTTSS